MPSDDFVSLLFLHCRFKGFTCLVSLLRVIPITSTVAAWYDPVMSHPNYFSKIYLPPPYLFCLYLFPFLLLLQETEHFSIPHPLAILRLPLKYQHQDSVFLHRYRRPTRTKSCWPCSLPFLVPKSCNLSCTPWCWSDLYSWCFTLPIYWLPISTHLALVACFSTGHSFSHFIIILTDFWNSSHLLTSYLMTTFASFLSL